MPISIRSLVAIGMSLFKETIAIDQLTDRPILYIYIRLKSRKTACSWTHCAILKKEVEGTSINEMLWL